MIDESNEEQAALYALGLLEDQELLRFAAELRENPALAELAADFGRVTALLANEAPQHAPPADLKRRILEQIRAERPAPVSERWQHTWLAWAAAAVFFCGCAALALERGRLMQEAARLRQVAALDHAEILELRQRDDLARLEIVQLRSQLAQNPSARAIAVWDPERQRGVLDLAQLPHLRANQDYQLWLIDPAYADPVNGGVLRMSDGGNRVAFEPGKPVHHLAKLAVSLERQGGVPKAEGPMVLLSD